MREVNRKGQTIVSKMSKNITRPLREDEKEYVLSKLNKQAYKVGLNRTLLFVILILILCILIDVVAWFVARKADVIWLGVLLFVPLSIMTTIVMLSTRNKVKKVISMIRQNELRVQDVVCEEEATVLSHGRSSILILQTNEYKIATFDYVEYDHLKKGDRGIILWALGYKIVIKGIEDQISKEAGS